MVLNNNRVLNWLELQNFLWTFWKLQKLKYLDVKWWTLHQIQHISCMRDLCTFENWDPSIWSKTVKHPFWFTDKCLAENGSESSRKNWVFDLVQALGIVSGGLGTALLWQGTLRGSDMVPAQPAITAQQTGGFSGYLTAKLLQVQQET